MPEPAELWLIGRTVAGPEGGGNVGTPTHVVLVAVTWPAAAVGPPTVYGPQMAASKVTFGTSIAMSMPTAGTAGGIKVTAHGTYGTEPLG